MTGESVFSSLSKLSLRVKRWTCCGIVLLGLSLAAHGMYIPAKAQLAQLLLHRAWLQSEGQPGARPWPWADTSPIARLRAKPAGYSVDQLVLSHASGRNLAFGPTHISPSAPPGSAGHVVLSGHRDTHFKWLADLALDDSLRIDTHRASQTYRVIGREIIDLEQHNFELLADGDLLTLVTCYPFDAVSPNTNQRYLVHAERVATSN